MTHNVRSGRMNGATPYPRRKRATYRNQLYAVVCHQQTLLIAPANKNVLALRKMNDSQWYETKRSFFSDSFSANSVKRNYSVPLGDTENIHRVITKRTSTILHKKTFLFNHFVINSYISLLEIVHYRKGFHDKLQIGTPSCRSIFIFSSPFWERYIYLELI